MKLGGKIIKNKNLFIMKKFSFSMLFVIFSLCILSSCKTQNEPVVNNLNELALKAQLAKIPAPSKEEMKEFIAGKLGPQKAKSEQWQDLVLVEIFELDSTTYIIEDGVATKNFLYVEIASNGDLKKKLTIGQVFQISGGNIVENDYHFNYQISCPFSRYFHLQDDNNVQNITYFFHFNDGYQLSYNGNSQIKLPPIKNGKWQLRVTYYDGDLWQSFMTELVNYYSESSNLIKLKFDIKETNIVSVVSVSKLYIKDAYSIQFEGRDDDGYYTYVSYPVSYDESLPNVIIFNLPIKNLKRAFICSNNGCSLIQPKEEKTEDGKVYYSLE